MHSLRLCRPLYPAFVLQVALLSGAPRPAAGEPAAPPPASVPEAGRLVASDDFDLGLGRWRVELEKAGRVEAHDGRLEVDVPGGCTVWFRQPLEGPLRIEYEATVIQAGGPNDRVSDLNCFWMARDARSPADIFGVLRSGVFSDYDMLRCYYVGLGGNANSTSRFRRYVGEPGNRPLLPEHDLSRREYLLVPNAAQKIGLLASGSNIAFYRDGRQLFALEDSSPYTSGWFAFRTTRNHMLIRHFRVYALAPEGRRLQGDAR